MSASIPFSTRLPASTAVPSRANAGVVLWLLMALLLAAYAGPWLQSPSAALSFGGYDLAEWASLPPGVRSASPPLVASFLLRSVLTSLTLFLAFASPYRRFTVGWLAVAVVSLLLVAAQLPPLEFFTVARGDPNYSQQAVLAIVSLVGAIIALVAPTGKWRVLLAAAFALVSAVCAIAGVLSTQALITAYQLQPQVGLSVYIFAVLAVVAALWCAWRFVRLAGTAASG